MTTITGTIQNSQGAVLAARLAFTSRSTPQFSGGVIQANSKIVIQNEDDGTFELQLAAGNYTVFIIGGGLSTQFTIAVPAGDDTYPIDDLVSSDVAELPSGALIISGSADPEGSVTAPEGSLYNQIVAGTFIRQFIKTGDGGNTGWQ